MGAARSLRFSGRSRWLHFGNAAAARFNGVHHYSNGRRIPFRASGCPLATRYARCTLPSELAPQNGWRAMTLHEAMHSTLTPLADVEDSQVVVDFIADAELALLGEASHG